MTFERRPALLPMAAIIVLVFAGCSSAGMSQGMPNVQSQPIGMHASNVTCQPNFTLSLSPSSATITSGQNARIAVELASLCGLAGNINVGIHKIVPQPNGNGFTINQPRYDIPLDANGTAVAYITLGATPNTLKTTYTITIQGKNVQGGCCYGITHSAIFTLTVK